MHRAVAVCGIKPDLDPHVVAHVGIRCATDITVQVQIKVALADPHHVDAPRLFRGFPIDAYEYRKRLAPARLDGPGAYGAHVHIRIAVEYLDRRDKGKHR